MIRDRHRPPNEETEPAMRSIESQMWAISARILLSRLVPYGGLMTFGNVANFRDRPRLRSYIVYLRSKSEKKAQPNLLNRSAKNW